MQSFNPIDVGGRKVSSWKNGFLGSNFVLTWSQTELCQN